MRSKLTQQRGSALAMVLIFITVFVMLGTGLFALAQTNVRQSVALLQAEQNYFLAESAVLVADAAFMHEVLGVFDEMPTYAIGASESQSRDALYSGLTGFLSSREGAAIAAAIANSEGLDSGSVHIYFEINEDAIQTQVYEYGEPPGENTYISFFGEPNGDGTFSFYDVDILTYHITATTGRAARITRTLSLDEDTSSFTPATPPGGYYNGNGSGGGGGGGGFWLGGSNLISSGADWSVPISSNVGVNVYHDLEDYDFLPPPNSDFPARGQLNTLINRPDEYGHVHGHTQIPARRNEIRDEIFNRIIALNPAVTRSGETLNPPPASSHTTSPVRRYTWSNAPPAILTPAALAGVHTLWSQGGPTLNLVGDFPDLRAIYGAGNVYLSGSFPNLDAVFAGGINLGDTTHGFESDRGTAGRPLYIISLANNNPVINLSQGAIIKNAIIALGNTTTISGNSGNNLIQMDAIFYVTNPINISLDANNWDTRYVPTFITNNTITANVTARPGFSGILYSTGNVGTITIDAPIYNGALIIGTGFSALTLNNTCTENPGPVDFYLRMGANAHNNLPPSLSNYFGQLIEIDDDYGDGGVIIIPGTPAVFRGSAEPATATLREVTGM